jgi:hypothetical protein
VAISVAESSESLLDLYAMPFVGRCDARTQLSAWFQEIRLAKGRLLEDISTAEISQSTLAACSADFLLLRVRRSREPRHRIFTRVYRNVRNIEF